MTELNQVYKCSVCGNIVEVIHTGAGELVCCGLPMDILDEKKTDTGLEKHVPIIEQSETNVKVKVGSIPHPMEDKHYIEWIELIGDGKVYRAFLNPNQKPEVIFNIKTNSASARAYCNLHGLWKS